MKNVMFILLAALVLCVSASAQTTSAANGGDTRTAASADKPKRRAVFRPTKTQITAVQTSLKEKGSYGGEVTGRMNDGFRAAIRAFQKDNGLRQTGTLNRATLERLGIELTDNQKAIPVDPNSFAAAGDETASASKRRRPVFRASRAQVTEAQKVLKANSLYSGEETGRLNQETRAGIRKYQEANGLAVTGTLNQATVEKMGIALTERQQANAAAAANEN